MHLRLTKLAALVVIALVAAGTGLAYWGTPFYHGLGVVLLMLAAIVALLAGVDAAAAAKPEEPKAQDDTGTCSWVAKLLELKREQTEAADNLIAADKKINEANALIEDLRANRLRLLDEQRNLRTQRDLAEGALKVRDSVLGAAHRRITELEQQLARPEVPYVFRGAQAEKDQTVAVLRIVVAEQEEAIAKLRAAQKFSSDCAAQDHGGLIARLRLRCESLEKELEIRDARRAQERQGYESELKYWRKEAGKPFCDWLSKWYTIPTTSPAEWARKVQEYRDKCKAADYSQDKAKDHLSDPVPEKTYTCPGAAGCGEEECSHFNEHPEFILRCCTEGCPKSAGRPCEEVK